MRRDAPPRVSASGAPWDARTFTVADDDPYAALPAEAADALRGYMPALADDSHTELIRSLVLHHRPRTAAQVSRAAGALSGLVHWAEGQGLPLEPETLLDQDVINTHVASLTTLAPGTRDGITASLVRTARGHAGVLFQTRARTTRASPKAPYAPAEVDALLLWAANQPLTSVRQALLSVLVLGLGAGLTTDDLVVVDGTDIRTDPATGCVVVDVRHDNPRTVAFLRRYEQEALRLAAVAGPGWVFRPDVDPDATWARTGDGINYTIANVVRTTGVQPLHPRRCRITWVVHHLAAGTRLDVLSAAAGYKHPRFAAENVHYLVPPPLADAARTLRDAAVAPHGHPGPAP